MKTHTHRLWRGWHRDAPRRRGFQVCFGHARRCLSPLFSFRVQQLTDGPTFVALRSADLGFDAVSTLVIKSFNGGRSSNQMEDANTNRDRMSHLALDVMYNQIEDE
jgi:hypothetical protein